jgi:hypothetical protein
MFSIHSSSFTANNDSIYAVLIDYLALPALNFWSGIDGHSYHEQDGWDVNSDMNILNQRVDKLTCVEITVVVVWESFNSKEIESIEVTFHKESYIHMRAHIMDDLYALDDELMDHLNSVAELSAEEKLSETISAHVATLLGTAKDSATLTRQYKLVLEKLEAKYFSLPGLQALAQRFSV